MIGSVTLPAYPILIIAKDHAVWKLQRAALQGFIRKSSANACPRNNFRLQAFYLADVARVQNNSQNIHGSIALSDFEPFLWGYFLIASRSVRREFIILTVDLSGFLHPGHLEPWARLPRLHQVPLLISQTLTLLRQVSMPWEFCALSWQLALRLSDSTRSSISSRFMDGKTVRRTLCVTEYLYYWSRWRDSRYYVYCMGNISTPLCSLHELSTFHAGR